MSERLGQEQVGYASVWQELLGAALAAQSGATRETQRLLEEVIVEADAVGFGLCAAARHRLGEILGGARGERLLQKADSFMAAQEIKNPPRMLQVVAPGFPRHR